MAHKKIDSLQLLRAIAVGFVIFIHASYFGVPMISATNPVDSIHNLKSWGAIGVDLFFTISGFIMTIIAPSHTGPGGWKSFFMKRIIRIVPLYYLLSAFELVYFFHGKASIYVLIKTLIFFPIFDKGQFVLPVLTVGWSLSYEMYFYTLIGIVLILRKNIYQRLLVIMLGLSIIGAIFNPANPLLKFLTSPILIEFGYGILCGLAYKKFNSINWTLQKKKTIAAVLLLSGVVLLICTILITAKYDIHDQSIVENNSPLALYRVLIWGLPCAVFLMGTTLFESAFNLKIAGFLILAGDASYSCYLIHGLIYKRVAKVFVHFSLGPIFYLIIIVPVCVLVSILFYKVVERSLISFIDKRLKYKKPVIMN